MWSQRRVPVSRRAAAFCTDFAQMLKLCNKILSLIASILNGHDQVSKERNSSNC